MRQNILVIQPLPGIGDSVWFVPHLQALCDHYPKGDVTLLAKPGSRADQVLEGTIPLKEVLWLKRESGEHSGLTGFFKLVKLLKEHAFDRVWILHKSPRYALAAKLAGIPEIYGYGFSFSRFFTTPPLLEKEERSLHPIYRAKALLVHHGVDVSDFQDITLHTSKMDQELVAKRYGIKARQKVAILGIGGSEIYKKWPAAFFAEVGIYLEKKGFRVLILGGLQERREAELIQMLIDEGGGHATTVVDLSIQEAFALLSMGAFFLGNDTGMLNAAAMVNIPTFGFFAKTPPLQYRSNLHPLTPKFEGENMEAAVGDITVDQALEALSPLL